MRSARFACSGQYLLFACAILILMLAPSAHAWNAAGHRIVASIAWSECTIDTRRQISSLLEAHPASARWDDVLARRRATDDPTLARFAEASTWPDDLRRESSGDTDDAHRDWHYVNWIVGDPAGNSRGGQLDRAIVAQTAILGDRGVAAATRAEALAWLAHLVADAHQPMHVASWRLPDGKFDDGGLGLTLRDPTRPISLSLHSWWDDLPGPPWLRGDQLARRSREILNAHHDLPTAEGAPRVWLEESFMAASDWIRPPNSDPTRAWDVESSYRDRAKILSSRRLHQAGVRLGRLLNQVMGDGQPVTKR